MALAQPENDKTCQPHNAVQHFMLRLEYTHPRQVIKDALWRKNGYRSFTFLGSGSSTGSLTYRSLVRLACATHKASAWGGDA